MISSYVPRGEREGTSRREVPARTIIVGRPKKPAVVACAYNPSTQAAETEL